MKAAAKVVVGPGATAQALLLAWDFAKACDLDDEPSDKLAIVMEEWVLNVVDHGEADGGEMEIVVERLDARVRLTVVSPGLAFDPRKAGFDGPNLERGGGAGLALIQAWTRIVSYRRRAGLNRVVFEMDAA